MTWCPSNPLTHLSLGDLFYERGDPEKARYHYRRYLALAPQAVAARRVQDRLRLLEL